MATFLHGESRRMYSWWWDSHISPKNSKWLQENLTDIDRNVKAMIKLIEEDADSFARRAEMYYKKRPELMKMVEEFYRAYRALAERYDHATSALRQAHRTMTEAFPNQIPPILPDDSPSGVEIGPHAPEVPSPIRALVDLDDSLAASSHFHPRRRSGVYNEENDSFSSKKGLKQLKEMFPSGEGKVRKFLNFKEEEGTVKEKEDLIDEIKRLQEEVAKLSTKNENLLSQMESESQHPRTLEETVLKLESVKETALLQYKLSIERLSTLETGISNTRGELNKANDEMVVTLDSVEEQCLAMEKANKSLQLELETQQNELETRAQELEELNTLIEDEQPKRLQAEEALMSLEQIHTHSQEEAELLVLEFQRGNEKLKDMELSKVGLEETISELNEIIGNLHDDNKSCSVKINEIQNEMNSLKETKEKLEYELGISLEENKDLQKELCCLKEDQQDLEVRHQDLNELMKVILEKNVLLENSLSDANVELEGLREKANALEASCETLLGEDSAHVVETVVLASQIVIISQNLERFTGKNILLENSLSDTNAELENSRARCKDLEECCTSFCDQNSALLAAKSTLVSQVENLESKYSELQDQHSNLEREKDSMVQQVMELQSSLRTETQEHEALIMSLLSQLASLHNQIYLLEEKIQMTVKDFEMEQEKAMNSLFETFIKQRCLCDMKDSNVSLFRECQNLLEASRYAENQISLLKQKELIQTKEIASLLQRNDVLSKGIHLLLEELNIGVKKDSITDEVLVQITLGEAKNLLISISNAQDENQQLQLKVLSLESKYLTLQDHHNNLEREKGSTIHQIMELENSLSLQKQEHEALTLSFLSQLASLQKQIHFLQEEIRVGDVELEMERQKTINADLENFVLQRCLCDMKDNNLTLSGECQNLLEALQHSEKCISQLEHRDLIQKNELTLLSNHCKVLRANIHEVLQALSINTKNGIMDYSTDEVLLQSILGEISHLMSSISDANDENQLLCLELLIKDTLFQQIGLDKLHLHHELDSRTKELLALEKEKHDLIDMNKQLKDEKNFFISQVEIIRHGLEIVETKYSELEEKKLFLEREKDSAFHQVLELECSLKLEKQEHHALLSSSNSQLASLETQLDLLKKERQVREDEFEIEQQNTMNVLLENFILQSCLHNMKDGNSLLSVECQKLEYDRLIQEKEMMLVSENNEKLRIGILLLLKELNINMECGTIDETKDEVLLQALRSEIKAMMNCVSNGEEKMKHLYIEISVLVTLLKCIGLEKSHLYYELASQNQEFLSVQNKKDEALQVFTEQLSDLHVSLQRLQTENCTLLEEKHLLLKRFFDLMEKMDTLEGENNNVFTEALILDHLFIFFKSLSVERGFKLKLLSDDIYNIIAVKIGLDEEIRVQNERKRELEVENMNLMELAVLQEFDLNMARNFCEEFNQQIDAAGKLLIQKKMEISDARVENTELCTKLKGLKKDLDSARVIRKALEEEVETLSSNIASKDEITDILETNTLLCTEVDRLNCEVQAHKRREELLYSELQKRSGEVCKCEGEIQTLFNHTHFSTVNAVIFEEKVLELIVECEGLETFSMLQREIFGEEFALNNACIDDLKKKLEDLEGENGSLKAELNAYSSLLMSLFDGVACVEEHIFSLALLLETQGDGILDSPMRSSHQPSEKEKISDLQKLIAKIESLQKVIIDTKNLLKQERLDSNVKIESAMKEIEELKHKERLLKEISKEAQTMKDIQLDQMSNSRINSSNTNRIEYAESDEQMLELWEETAERDDGIEVAEEVKSEHPSCELSLDKPEVSAIINESPREWNKRVNKKLDSDAQRLSFIQRSLREFKTKLEGSEKKKPDNWECGTLKMQLREAEEAILQQVDINGKLKKKVEENFESPNERRQISEQAKKGSEKIGKLELELQKIEYIFLKVHEENENKKNVDVERKTSILLSEHIYGKKDGKGKRRSRICGCMRPKTKN